MEQAPPQTADGAAAPGPPLPAWGPPSAPAAFAYPSVDPGFPALGLDELLAANADLLAQIKICYGVDRETFERDVLSLVRRYAAFVHLLPATPANYFNVPGGLLRLGLETAFFALQGTDAHIFSGRATISTRRHLEPRWRLATFIAGLCAEIHRTLGQVIVTDREGSEWQPYLQGVQPWLAEHGVARYYLKWIPNAPETPGIALFVLPLVVPAATLQHLAQGNTVVVPHLMASLSAMPLYREHNILGELVRRSAALVIDRFLQASADRYGKPQLGSHLERYLVDALRRLVATNPAWTPNAERSRVWYGSDGLFIVWPNAAADMRKMLETDQLPGIPKSPETMLEILLGAGVFVAQPGGQPLWTIAPPGAKTPLEAVRLTAPAAVLAGVEPKPEALTDALVAGPHGATPAAAQPAPKPAPAAAPAPPQAPQPRAESAYPVPSPVPVPTPAPVQVQLEFAVDPPPAANAGEPAPVPAADGSTAALPAEAEQAQRQRLALEAPMRLAPRIRDALANIIDAVNTSAAAATVCATPAGLFIALTEFERRGVEPSLALRALAEARMLSQGADPQTPASTCTIGGQAHLGLSIHPRFLSGLAPAVKPPSAGD